MDRSGSDLSIAQPGIFTPFSHSRRAMAVLLAPVSAELVRYGPVVFDYRRGWHG